MVSKTIVEGSIPSIPAKNIKNRYNFISIFSFVTLFIHLTGQMFENNALQSVLIKNMLFFKFEIDT